MNPFVLILAILRRHRLITLLFTAIVALSIALGTGIISQEKALRQGTTTAADKFDLIVGAPGSQIDLLLNAVYLQPRDVELLEGKVLSEIAAHPETQFVAPLAFGDNYKGLPIVGSTPEFVTYLSDDQLDGRVFAAVDEAIAGADVPLALGDRFKSSHGHFGISEYSEVDVEAVDIEPETDVESETEVATEAGEETSATDGSGDAFLEALAAGTHKGFEQTVVGRLPRTGTPWDRALITPVESVWLIHDLPTGHDPAGARADAIGAPFDAEFLTGVPALIVKPQNFAGAYTLRGEYRDGQTTAFFPAEVLLDLYAIMGDARAIMSFLTLMTQVLVLLGIFAGILALMQLFKKQFGVLRALGAPRLYLFATLWGFLALLISVGSVVGLGLGWSFSSALSLWLSHKTGIAIQPGLGAVELWSAGRFILIGYGLALIPSTILYQQSPIDNLNHS